MHRCSYCNGRTYKCFYDDDDDDDDDDLYLRE